MDVVDRPPEIDDLEALLWQFLRILGREVASHARDGRRGRLVYVQAHDRLLILRCVVDDSRAPAAAVQTRRDKTGGTQLPGVRAF